MSNVFISYRREDSAPYAGRICDRLSNAFGSGHVFMDVDDITPGTDFADAIEKTVSACDVLVAVIGPEWIATLQDRNGKEDFVRHEVAAALRRGVMVIPVLVGGAAMPRQDQLPEELAGLARRQAAAIQDTGFDRAINELIGAIRKASGGRSPKRLLWLIAIAGVLVAIAGSAIFLLNSREKLSIDGNWIAHMQRPGQRAYNIRMRLEATGPRVTGQVQYPTGSAIIEGGTLERGRLFFFTRHTPQFETEPARIEFNGIIRGKEIDLTSTQANGIETKGIARKVE